MVFVIWWTEEIDNCQSAVVAMNPSENERSIRFAVRHENCGYSKCERERGRERRSFAHAKLTDFCGLASHYRSCRSIGSRMSAACAGCPRSRQARGPDSAADYKHYSIASIKLLIVSVVFLFNPALGIKIRVSQGSPAIVDKTKCACAVKEDDGM